VEIAAAARDAGVPIMLIERPMPDAVSVVALGTAFEIVSVEGGAAVVDATGVEVDRELGLRLSAASRLWRRLQQRLGGDPDGLPGVGSIAVGGFAFRTDREPAGAWTGFPGLLFRVPALAVVRVRGRTFATCFGDDGEALLELQAGFRAPPARTLEVAPVRGPEAWKASVREATARMRSGQAEKVVLAREVIVRADGAVAAATVARALRSSFPSCFTYLVTGYDGTAFVGASPELLVRRAGNRATSQPMAGSIARGTNEAEDDRLAAQLSEEGRFAAEHAIVSGWVVRTLEPHCVWIDEPGRPEVVRFTNIQHLATTIRAELREPCADVLELAAALHPTPAVGGQPLQPALGMIDELELMERGWYAGGVGWMDGRGDGEVAVALRCGLLWEDGARLFAGNGMMPDADPETEFEESEMKLRALLGALLS